MAKIHIPKVVVLNNPAPFFSPFKFEITLECIEDLPHGKLRVIVRKLLSNLGLNT